MFCTDHVDNALGRLRDLLVLAEKASRGEAN